MSEKFFLNYRQADTKEWVARVFDRFKSEFGEKSVLLDVETIKYDQQISAVLKQKLENCEIFLAFVGASWADAVNGPRLQEENDPVRFEIETAEALGKHIMVVLVDDARMPKKEHLPASLQDFAEIKARELRYATFERDIDEIVKAIREIRVARRDADPNGALEVASIKRRFVSALENATHLVKKLSSALDLPNDKNTISDNFDALRCMAFRDASKVLARVCNGAIAENDSDAPSLRKALRAFLLLAYPDDDIEAIRAAMQAGERKIVMIPRMTMTGAEILEARALNRDVAFLKPLSTGSTTATGNGASSPRNRYAIPMGSEWGPQQFPKFTDDLEGFLFKEFLYAGDKALSLERKRKEVRTRIADTLEVENWRYYFVVNAPELGEAKGFAGESDWYGKFGSDFEPHVEDACTMYPEVPFYRLAEYTGEETTDLRLIFRFLADD